jgi:hypothetical protein
MREAVIADDVALTAPAAQDLVTYVSVDIFACEESGFFDSIARKSFPDARIALGTR